jgi:hypothetical protein
MTRLGTINGERIRTHATNHMKSAWCNRASTSTGENLISDLAYDSDPLDEE